MNEVSHKNCFLLGGNRLNTSFTLFVVTALNNVLGNKSVKLKDKRLTLVFQNPTFLVGTVGDDLTTNLPVHWHI
jgi:hypothetical protein